MISLILGILMCLAQFPLSLWTPKSPNKSVMTVSKLSLAKDKIKVLLLENVHKKAVELFERHGYHHIEQLGDALDEAELKSKIIDAHMIGIRSRTQLSENVMAAAEKLMVIGCFCIGTNQVDTLNTKMKGIPVFNAPYSNTRSVAELVLAEAIMLFRGRA